MDAALDEFNPWAVVNAAGYVRVDDAELEEDECYRTNCGGVALLAAACARHAAPLLAFSSDMVFNGQGVINCVVMITNWGASRDAVAFPCHFGGPKGQAQHSR